VSSVAGAALSSWTVPPWAAVLLLLSGLVYLRGWRRLVRLRATRFPLWRLASFLGGLSAVWIAVASPLDAFASLLLTAHMAQHLLLMAVAPPLLLLGAPEVPLLHGLPRGFVREGLGPFLAWPSLKRAGRALTHPLVGLAAMAAATCGWHVPAAYELALGSPGWHEVEHASFFLASILFWWPVVRPWPSRPHWPAWTVPLYLLAGDLQNTALAAILTFSDGVLYSTYAATPRLFGLTALEDQALAGVLMWVPGSLVFLVPAGAAVWRLLSPESPVLPAPPPPAYGSVRRAPFDLLRAPFIGRFLRARYGRRALQAVLFLLAALVVADGFLGPPAGAANLAGALPWTWGRTIAVVALLAVGNLFCMACPFTLPRELAKRLGFAGRPFPPALRSKWLAVALLVLFFWAYEAFGLWDRPAATAGIVVAYFAAAFLVDALFRGASFCKYLCPIGQFQFAGSLVSPLEVRVREPEVCARCTTHDCLRGNAGRRGCELDLFLPSKAGSLDCTFCLDCVKACPHDNVGLLPVLPASQLWRDPARSSVGRFARRPDLAALALVVAFGAFAGAAAMVEPFATLLARGGHGAVGLFFLGGLALIVAFSSAASAAGKAWSGAGAAMTEIFRRQAMALLPLAVAMWAAHLVFHFATAGPTAWPTLQRAALEAGIRILGDPRWSAAVGLASPSALLSIELLLLDAGLLLTLYAGWRLARELCSARSGRLFAAWGVFAAGLWAAGAWILLQPMAMRGMAH